MVCNVRARHTKKYMKRKAGEKLRLKVRTVCNKDELTRKERKQRTMETPEEFGNFMSKTCRWRAGRARKL